MKYSIVSGGFVVVALVITMISSPLFAKNQTGHKKNFHGNAVGIATSSINAQNIKEKLLKLRGQSAFTSSVDHIVGHYKKKIELK